MRCDQAIRYLRVLPANAQNAITAAEICQKLHGFRPEGGRGASRMRAIYRDLAALGQEDVALVDHWSEDGTRRYHLKPNEVVSRFMSDAMALQVALSSGALFNALGQVLDGLSDDAEEVARQRLSAASSHIQRLYQRVRLVPDGIGRQPTKVEPKVLRAVTEAITRDMKVRLTYRNSGGRCSERELNPLALVAKDGTLYLVGAAWANDAPRSYALQRVLEADVSKVPADPRAFDIDRYIDETHQFGHPIPVSAFLLRPVSAGPVGEREAERLEPSIEMLDLELRVAPRALFHFRERPITRAQTIGNAPGRDDEGRDDDPDTWSVVRARVPYTVLLLPFLLSLGQWVRVDAPAAVRDQMRIVVGEMAKVCQASL